MRVLTIAVVALAGSLALCACAKSNNSASEASSSPEATPATSAAPVSSSGSASPAATTYTANCASCHQPGGKGLAGSFPPLAGNPVVTGDPQKVIHIVKYGLTGKIMVGPDIYNGMMPPWGSQLSAEQIAGVITYIRTSWGNSASPVTAAAVSAVKN